MVHMEAAEGRLQQRNIWRSSDGRKKKQREEAEKAPGVKKSERKISSVGRPSMGEGGGLYLGRAGAGAPEGRALCPRGRCPGSSCWGRSSLMENTPNTSENTISCPLPKRTFWGGFRGASDGLSGHGVCF